MEVAVVEQHRTPVEFGHLHNQGRPYPVTDALTKMARGNIFPARRSVRGDDAEKPAVDVVVQKHDLTRVLHDLLRRSNAWNSWRLALKHSVGLDLPVT